tara:strand:+ start:3612 stop:3830 length:219 start_codon:yes stop_codon:yes gene_type:complete
VDKDKDMKKLGGRMQWQNWKVQWRAIGKREMREAVVCFLHEWLVKLAISIMWKREVQVEGGRASIYPAIKLT